MSTQVRWLPIPCDAAIHVNDLTNISLQVTSTSLSHSAFCVTYLLSLSFTPRTRSNVEEYEVQNYPRRFEDAHKQRRQTSCAASFLLAICLIGFAEGYQKSAQHG
jgi:hypothetical protein